jgi:hypothetical protein
MVTGLGHGELKTKRRLRGSSPKGPQRRGVHVESSRQRCFIFTVTAVGRLLWWPIHVWECSSGITVFTRCSTMSWRAWEAVCCCGSNGTRARLLRWGKVVVGVMGMFSYRSRNPGGWGTMPWIQIPAESRISLRVRCGFVEDFPMSLGWGQTFRLDSLRLYGYCAKDGSHVLGRNPG